MRAAGVTAEAVLGLLAWSCGWAEGIRPVNLSELLPRFRLGSIPPEPFALLPAHLRQIGYVALE